MNFDFDRFLKQMKWDALQNYRFVYIFYMVIFGLMMFTDVNGGGGQLHNGLFWTTIFLGGLIFTSIIFDEFNEPQSKQFYLTTPSSHLEKFSSKLFLTTVAYTMTTMIAFSIMSFIATFLLELRSETDLPSFNPFHGENVAVIKSYVIIQSVFLLGAATFSRGAFLKTIAAIIGISFVLSIIWMTVGVGAISQHFSFNAKFDFNSSHVNFEGIEGSMKGYSQVLKWLYFLLLAPLMWLITYFKLTEKEV